MRKESQSLDTAKSSTFQFQLADVYPQLAHDTQPETQALIAHSRPLDVPAKTLLMKPNTLCTEFMLLLDGTMRIFQHADDGREISLYRIHPGDTCLMSLNCLINDRLFPANTITETQVRALLITEEDFHRAINVSASFRQLVLSSMLDSMCDMMDTFHDTAFSNLDTRLKGCLTQLFAAKGSDTLTITHVELANELGTSREVVSRILKKLELRKCIELSRGQIRMGENRLSLSDELRK